MSEEQYQMLFREMQEGFALHEIICDAEGKPVDYRFLAVNPSFERMTGLMAQNIIGKRVLEILPDIELHLIETYGQVALTGEPTSFEYYSKEIGRHFEVRAFQPEPNQFACTITDISRNKRTEGALRASEERFKGLMDQSPVGIQILDMDGFTVNVNKAWEELWGISWEEFTKQEYNILEDKQVEDLGLMSSLKEAYTGKTVVLPAREYDPRHSSGEGTRRWVQSSMYPIRDGSGNILNVVVVQEDITERKRAERALAEQTRHREMLLDSLPHPTMLIDKSRTILASNRIAIDVGAETGKQCWEGFGQCLFIPEKDQLHLKEHNTAPPGGTRCSFCKANECLSANRHQRDPEVEAFGRIWDMHWVPLGDDETYLHYAIDVTEQKEKEDEREKLQEQLRQSQKMEAIGQLAGGVAHDFNNLLQAILGYGGLALEDLKEDAPARSSLKEIIKAGNRAAALVSQLLAFSRRQLLNLTDIDLNEIVTNLMKMIHRVIGEHITLSFIPGHELGTIRADRGQMEQIMMNLCVNARDAMPTGGAITIETENIRIDDEYCEMHTWARVGRYVLFSITDTGCGMDSRTLENVFEPFFTTKEVGEGTGLGLSTVYGIVKQHKGMVHIYSQVGKGSTFKIYLPQVERAVGAVGSKIEGAVPGGSETILVAEDDAPLLNLTRTILEKAGYAVLTAIDGEDALRVFEEHPDVIDMALLDVMMPKLGGRAVFDRIRVQRPQMRVLFASGYSMNAIHTDFVLEEGLQLVQKPYQRDILLRKVRETLDT